MAVNSSLVFFAILFVAVIGCCLSDSINKENIAGRVEIGEELSTDGVLTSRQTMLRVNVRPKLKYFEEIEERVNINTRMSIFTDSTFTEKLSIEEEKERRINSFKDVFYEISLENYFEGAQINLRSCWATPDQNSTNNLRYSILEDGCVDDDTFFMYESESPVVARFSIKSFRFATSSSSTFFMHCEVDICDGNSTQHCSDGCGDVRRKRSSLGKNDVRSNLLSRKESEEVSSQRGFFLNVACQPNKIVAAIKKPIRNEEVVYELNDPSCLGKETDTQIVFDTALDKCGTTLSQSNEKLIYRNVIKERPVNSIIVRHNPITVPFQCSYSQKTSSRTLKIRLKPPKTRVRGIGIMPYRVKIEMFTDDSFSRKIVKPIVEVDPEKLMYFQVKIESKHFELALFLDRCFGLPVPYFSGDEMYTFIKDGCATDRTVKFYEDPDASTKRFSMKPFIFGNVITKIFMNCHVTPCNIHSQSSVCKKGCTQS